VVKKLSFAFICLLLIAYPAYSVTISGHVSNSEGGIEGVLVTGSEVVDAGLSDSNGFYEVLVLSGWSGVLTATKTGMAFDPSERQYENITDSLTDQDYNETVRILTRTWNVPMMPILPAGPVAMKKRMSPPLHSRWVMTASMRPI